MRPQLSPQDTGRALCAAAPITTGSFNSRPAGIRVRPAPLRSTGGCTPSGCSRTGDVSGGTRAERDLPDGAIVIEQGEP
jgi:hypothetical protein